MGQEDEEVEMTKGGREFQNKTVDGRNNASQPGLLQTGESQGLWVAKRVISSGRCTGR